MLVPRTVAQTEWVATTSEQSINKMNKNYSDNVISVYNLIYSMLVHRAQACESVCLSVSVCVCLQCASIHNFRVILRSNRTLQMAIHAIAFIISSHRSNHIGHQTKPVVV